MSGFITVGLDLAKNVFQVHGADGAGQAVLRKKLRRTQVLEFFAQLQPCVVAMEACGGAHFWAREIGKLGHEVRLVRRPLRCALVSQGGVAFATAARLRCACSRQNPGLSSRDFAKPCRTRSLSLSRQPGSPLCSAQYCRAAVLLRALTSGRWETRSECSALHSRQTPVLDSRLD